MISAALCRAIQMLKASSSHMPLLSSRKTRKSACQREDDHQPGRDIVKIKFFVHRVCPFS
jgi:hypothetical protein